MGLPPNHPKLDHVSIETIGFWGYLHFRKPPFYGFRNHYHLTEDVLDYNYLILRGSCHDMEI